ncbi:MAG: PLP-dependent aminotransferase family protein [Myxococcales bacterium]
MGRYRPKLIYTLPTFQNPSGASLSLPRRKRLLELAWRYQVPIVEDDLYSDLRYEGEPLPALRALDQGGYVVYLSSVSKVLFPGLRIGWVVAPRPFLRTLALSKQAVDLHSGTLGQWLVDAFLREGHYAPHVEKVRKAYAARRKAMLDALQEIRPKGLKWRRPEGGMYLWCTFPSRLPPARLLARAARERVSYLPGEACLTGEAAGEHPLRLNFSYPPLKQIRPGIERLARALEAVSAEKGPRASAGNETRPIT